MNEEFKVSFKLVDDGFEEKVDKIDSKLKAFNSNRKVTLSADVRDFDKQTRQAFETFNKNANKYSKVSIKTQLFGDPRKEFAFARLFNDIRDAAGNALRDIEQQSKELSLKIKLDDESSKELDRQYDEAISKLQALEAEKAQFEYDSDPSNIDFDKIIAEQAKWRMLRAEAIKAQKSAANPEEYEKATQKIKECNAELEKLNNKTAKTGPTEEEVARYEEVKRQIAELEPLLKRLDKQLESTEFVKEEDIAKLQALRAEANAIKSDLEKDPIKFKMESDTLGKWSKQALQLKQRFAGVNKEARKFNLISKLGLNIASRMRWTIVNWLNPLNAAKKVWAEFKNQNEDVANTFEMIGKNLVKVFEPMMRKIVNWLLKAAQYLNIFTKVWFGVDLFDKSVLSSDKMKDNLDEANKKLKEAQSYTAGFDELHVFEPEKEDEDDLSLEEELDKIPTVELPDIDKELAKKLEGLAEKLKPAVEWLGEAFNWALEHPILAGAAILGGKWALGFLGGQLTSLIGKGFKKLFGIGGGAAGGKAVAGAAAKGATATAGIWATKFGTALKVAGGAALTVVGSAMVGDAAYNMTKYWDKMSTGEKVLRGVETAAGLAVAGIGGYVAACALAGSAAGPIGAAIGVVVGALTGIVVSAVTARDGILSVKDATEQYNSALELQAQCQLDYTNAVTVASQTLAQLEQIERATGLSGAALAEQVENGTLAVENMTSAQMQVYAAYLQNQQAVENLKIATENKKIADQEAAKAAIELSLSNAQASESYDQLKDDIIKAWKEGTISTSEARDYFERAMADMSNDARETWGRDIPEEIKSGLDPSKYQAWGRSLVETVSGFFSSMWKSAQETWQRICNLFSGKGFKTNAQVNGDGSVTTTVASYDVGTPYVPNDQLAMVHKGEAIIPARYNNPSTFGGGNNEAMARTISEMNSEIANLRNLIQQGIPVTGTFKQRGTDLIATVEKAKSRQGSRPISNVAYAR